MGKILGESFKKYVVNQINQRQNAHGSGITNTRTSDQLTYLNSKTAWVKLASGTRVTSERIAQENIRSGFAWDTLATQHVLFGGLSARNKGGDPLDPRGTYPTPSPYGNIIGNHWGTYNVNATNQPDSEFGLVPMPGITSADIKCMNRGSIKKATVNIKCYSPEQFQIIDLLYLRLGYTVFLEWGNSIFLDGKGNIQRQSYTLIEEEDYGFFSSVWKDSSYSGFLPMIEKYRIARYGNYDGLLAKVVNFSWTFSQDGSYDISLELISLGDVIESLKLNISPSYNISQTINALYALYSEDQADTNDTDLVSSPANNVISSYLFLQKIFLDANQNPEGYNGDKRITNKQVTVRVNGQNLELGGTFIVPPKGNLIKLDPIYTESPEFDTYVELEEYMKENYSNYAKVGFDRTPNTVNEAALYAVNENSWTPLETSLGSLDITGLLLGDVYASIKTIPDPIKINKSAGKGDVVYFNYNTGVDDEDLIIDSGFYMRFGHLLQYINDKVIPVIKNTGNSKGKPQTKIIKIDYDTWGNKMYTLPYQVSLDPRVCLINPVEQINTKLYYPELDPFKNPDYGYGWTMNIYLSHDQILASLNENTDEKGNVSLFDFLSSMCTAINKALGGINNLEPFLDEDTNTIHLVDASFQPKVTKSPYVLELYGYNKDQSGFVRNFNLKTEITNDFATMASVGSTAGGYVKGVENTMFSKWNKGLIDRWKEGFEPADPDSRPTAGSEDEPVKAYISTLWNKTYSAFGYTLLDIENDSSWFGYGETAGMNSDLIDTNISVVTEFYKYVQAKIQAKYDGKYSSPSNGFIPISLGITMDGLSGIKIYNEVNVDTRFLPKNYPDNLRFIIKGVNHKLSGNDWETNLETIVISRTTDGTNPPLTQKEIKSIIDSSLGNTMSTSTDVFNVVFNGAPNPATTPPATSTSTEGPPSSWPVLRDVVPSKYKHIRYADGGNGGVAGCKPSQDRVNPKLLEDLEKAAITSGVTPTITTAITGHGKPSRHNPSGNAVDIAIFNGKGYGSKQAAINNGIYNSIIKFVDELVKLGYAKQIEYGKDKGVLYFGFPNHDNHVHVSNRIK
jgi:hypothetical protein